MLIQANELRARQQSGEKFLLIDVREEQQWRSATLPQASHCNVYDYFIADGAESGLGAMAADAAACLQPLFASAPPGATPVFFEQQVGMRSPRGAWFAWLIGRDDALILDGGLDAYLALGESLEPGLGISHTLTTVRDAKPVCWQRSLVASREQALAADGVSGVNLDARRPAEYDGSFVHDCCQRPGRLPHAQLLFWEDVLEKGYFRSVNNLKALVHQAGLHPDQQLLVYCHREARAATVFVALRLAGFKQVSIYVGSWHEWAEQPNLPLVVGPKL